MAKWNVVAKDWEFSDKVLIPWKKFGYVSKSSTAGEIDTSTVGPFLESLVEQGIRYALIVSQIFSIVLPGPLPEPEPKPKREPKPEDIDRIFKSIILPPTGEFGRGNETLKLG
jgi:hypothetical protein